MNLLGMVYFFHFLWAVPVLFFSKATRGSDISRFEVNSLPGSPSLPTSWAGRLPVPGTQKGNNLFFWLFKTEDVAYDDDLIIWFNGGPGCSSLIGMTTGNGPLSFVGNSTDLALNPYSWTKLGHVLYVDQPVGTGFSTASTPYPAENNADVTTHFTQWLQSFLDLFPYLKSKNIHLMGESYAGIYIPYIASALLENTNPLSLNIKSISLGDGSWGNAAAMADVAMGTYLHIQAHHLRIPKSILSAFITADNFCGFTETLKKAQEYPPGSKFRIPGNPENMNYRRDLRRHPRRDLTTAGDGSCNINPINASGILDSVLNSTCYGPCATFSTAMDYLTTTSALGTGPPCYDVYDIFHNCSTIDSLPLLGEYFSQKDVQKALHVEESGPYSACNSTILGTLLGATSPVPPAYNLLPTLVTKHNLSLHIYNGKWDMLLNHIGTELSIQNMTWRGGQGFTERPHRLFFADNAAPADGSSCRAGAGVWAAERGVSYHLFDGAGHSVFASKPREMFSFVRDVVVGRRA
ncbi:Peptidase S10 serine carboxypeptidase [Penicillium manginii]|uniref:Peptidase S10 serine carboxypeptidase n=1 Tax=Penicillium manginii TaxID=203109 RepID=UPI0025491911|nr:Peptidase S10 serine carboxypeptidase [Penicillium manginii]KAJ5763812.1 Peptidase S10 serine carboxypeptidase [Penicillium manginii]